MHGSSEANKIYQIDKLSMVYNADKFQQWLYLDRHGRMGAQETIFPASESHPWILDD